MVAQLLFLALLLLNALGAAPPAAGAVTPVAQAAASSPAPARPAPPASASNQAAATGQAASRIPDQSSPGPPGRRPAPATPGQLAVQVSGNHLVDGSGNTIRLLGVNRSGAEYGCVQGWGMMDGPSDAASIAAIAAWHANTVRLPLNEDCWLGINGVPAAYAGANYQAFVEGFVQRLHAAGIYVILDLHWNAPGTYSANDQQPMADADHSITFWSQVAAAFKGDPATVFDLYNEPFLGFNGSSTSTDPWTCWRDGCTVAEVNQAGHPPTAVNWQTAGMQQLVDAVRGAGAGNVIMLGGLAYANDASGWLSHLPNDPAHQLALSAHVYAFNTCGDAGCWNSTFGPIASSYPVVTGEFGEDDCQSTFLAAYWSWADARAISYLAWTWDVWGTSCTTGSIFLVLGYDGAASSYGQAYHDHLLTMPGPVPPAAPQAAPARGPVTQSSP